MGSGRDFKIGITWQIGNAAAVTNSVNQVQGAFTKLQGSTATTSQGMTGLGTSIQGTLPAIKGQADAAQKSVGAQSAMAGAVGRSSNALSGFSAQVRTTSGALPALTSAQAAAGQSGTDLGTKTQQTTARLTQMGSKVGGLSFLFGGLIASMGEAQGTQEALEAQQQKLNEAQENAARIIEQYGENSNEAQDALKAVEKAEKSVAFAGRIARLSYQDQIFYILSLTSLAIGPAVTAFGKFREAQAAAAAAGVPLIASLRSQGGIVGRLFGLFDRLTGSTGKAATAMASGLSPALSNVGITTTTARNATTGFSGALAGMAGPTNSATKATGGLRGAISGLGGTLKGTVLTFGVIGAAMLAVGAAIAIISTNTFGARTALDNFGKSAGDQVPILGVLFEGIRDVAEAVGIAEDNGRSASDAWAAMDAELRKNNETVKTGGEAWAALFKVIQEHPITQAIISGFQGIGTEITNFFTNLGSQIETALSTVADLIVTNIVNPLLAIPGQIVSLGQDILNIITTGWNTFTGLIDTWIVQPILGIPGFLGSLGGQIVTAISTGWNTFTDLVQTWIIDPILGVPDNIGSIGNQIVTAISTGWNFITDLVNTWIITPLLNIPTLIPQLGLTIVNTIAAGWTAFVGLIQSNIVEPLLDIPSHISNLGQMIVDAIQQGWNTFTTFIQQSIVEPLLDIPSHIGNLGKLIIDTISNGWNTFTSIVDRFIVQPILDLPSHLSNLGQMIIDAFGNIGPAVTGWINTNLIDPFANFNKELDRLVLQEGKSIFDALGSMASGAHQEVKAATDESATATVNFQGKLEDMLKSAGKNRQALDTLWSKYLEVVPLANRSTIDAGEFMRNMAVNGIEPTDEQLKVLTATWQAYVSNMGDTQAQTEAVNEALHGTAEGSALAGTAAKEVTNAMTSLADANKTAAQDLTAYAQAMQEGTFQTMTHRQGLQEAELALVDLAAEFSNATGQVRFYSQENALAVRMALEFKLGVEEAKLELINQAAELARAAGAMQTYAQALRDGTIAENGYKQGILDASQALIDRVSALAESRAAFELNNRLIEEAGLLSLAFAEGEQEMKTSIQETSQELANQAGQLSALSDEANFASAAMNSLVQGFLDQEQALADLALSYFEAIGKIESLKQSMADIDQQMALLAVGFQTGRAEAFEWANGLAQAAGESMGLHSALEEVANGLDSEVVPAFRSSTEQLETFISAIAGVPEAVADVTSGIDDMASNIVDTLRKAGEDGKDAFSENLDKMEEELGVRFSDPVIQKIEFEADLAKAQEGLQRQLEGIAAAMKPVDLGDKVTFDTAAIKASIQDAINFIDRLPASVQPSVESTRRTLASLSEIDFNTASFDEIVGAMASIVAESENLGSSVPAMLQELAKMPEFAQRGVEGFRALDLALANTGFSVTDAGNIIEDATGRIITNIKDMPTQAQDPLTQLGNAILGTGTAADQARTLWATQMVAMKNVIAGFVIDSIALLANWNSAWTHNITLVAQTLGTFAQAVVIMTSTIATVLRSNLDAWGTWANDISGPIAQQALQGMFDAGRGAQLMHQAISQTLSQNKSQWTSWASAVGTAASGAASRINSSMSSIKSAVQSAISAVKQLQSAINSLRGKTVEIRIVRRFITIGTPFAFQHGGSFVVDKPTMIAGKQIGEFSKPELVTVTPLSNPNDITDKSTTINTSAVSRAVAEDTGGRRGKKGRGSIKKEVLEPIFVTIDGEVIMKMVQKRLLEFAGDNII